MSLNSSGDADRALDIVQETFINAARHVGTLREDGKFAAWLFGIAHQKVIQRWRGNAREEKLLAEYAGETPVAFADDPGELLVRKEQEERFMEMLNSLPLPQRSVLLLHFIEGFGIEEIAGITGTQPGTVKSRIHYAKKALRALIEEKS